MKDEDAFKTISEVAAELGLPQHVLRFWETKFNRIKPLKRGGGRRYYRPDDVNLLKGISRLLYDQGYTIKGVQRILKSRGSKFVASIEENSEPIFSPAAGGESAALDVSDFVSNPVSATASLGAGSQGDLQEILGQILECKRILDQAR